MAITFDGVTLQNPAPFELDHNPITKGTILLSGKRSVQSTAETAISATFDCQTDSSANITALKAKIGAVYILDWGDASCNAYISSFTEEEIHPDLWVYKVSFEEDST